MPDIKTVAVTGATGYVGRFVVAELQRHGISIRALTRPNSDRGGFDAPVEWIEGDLHTPAAFDRLVEGAGAVVHLAYEHVPGRYRGGEGDDLPRWLDANLNGSLRLLLAAQAARVNRLIFLSSRAVFSHTEPGRMLDESHPVSPDTHYGAYKAAVEHFLHSFASMEGGHLQTCSIRATGVYGITYPVERSKWWSLIQTVIQRSETPVIGRSGTEVHGGDVARTIYALLTQPGRIPDTIHLSDLVVNTRDVVRLARLYAGDQSGELPATETPLPENIMTSTRLIELGIRLGGIPLLEDTIKSMVQIARFQKVSD